MCIRDRCNGEPCKCFTTKYWLLHDFCRIYTGNTTRVLFSYEFYECGIHEYNSFENRTSLVLNVLKRKNHEVTYLYHDHTMKGALKLHNSLTNHNHRILSRINRPGSIVRDEWSRMNRPG